MAAADDPALAYPDGLPLPSRITMALDLRELYGPQVDLACHAREPDVDRWEAGELVPRPAQLAALAELTRFPVEFFLRPHLVGPVQAMWVCFRTKQQGSRCRRVDPSPDVQVQPGARLSPVRYAQASLLDGLG